MKQNKFFILAAALAFVACSSDDNYTAKEKAQQAPQEVSFSAYVNRGVTRAGATGELTLSGSTGLIATGFGVFAYYTNADFYDQTFTPNFMYNQKISHGSDWTYSPVKYWPNEFGSKAQSDDEDKVSFFAYAPWVDVNVTTGKVKADDTWGIVGMKKNNATGDPMVKYITTFFTDKQVDLVWGSVPKDQKWTPKNTETEETLSALEGKAWVDVEHPKQTSVNTESKVKFQFLHALAALNVQVDTYADKPTPTTGTTSATPNENTKVFIRSVTFEGFDTKAALNLNNTTKEEALWFTFDCCCEELSKGAETTIQDGRKDGKEGLTAATKEYAAINPNFVQDKDWASLSSGKGVAGSPANLFCKKDGTAAATLTDPIYVIPNGDPLKVTIEYDVLTADKNLAGKLNDGKTAGSVVKNVITRYITTDEVGSTTSTGAMTLVNGKKYTIKLHLGLNSVEFDADVTAWDTTDATGGADLPHNN